MAGAAKALNVGLSPFIPHGIQLEIFQKSQIMPPNPTAERKQVAKDFFIAFLNREAREFVKQMMIKSYTEAIMIHHPQAEKLNWGSIQAKCEILINTIFRRLEDIQPKPEYLFEILKSMGRLTRDNQETDLWFIEYQEAYNYYKHNTKLLKRDLLLFPHIVGNSLVDIGCGGGDQVAYTMKNHPDITEAAGIDILDWKTDGLKIDYHTLDFTKPGTCSPKMYDTGMLLAVLHHAGRTNQEIKTFLTGVKTAVGKRLIVEEDVMITTQDFSNRCLREKGLNTIEEKKTEQKLLAAYLGHSPETQRDITSIADLLANSLSVGVPEMAFPFGFRSIGNWVKIFAKNGFELNHLVILGFQPGNFNQQCHVIFILDRMR